MLVRPRQLWMECNMFLPWWMMRLGALLVCSSILIGLNGCGTNTASRSDVSDRLLCSSALATPITIYGTNDPRTEAGVDAHNGAYECVCNKDCPK